MINTVIYFFSWIFQTLFRIFPFPCKTGLFKINNPDSSSPVILTGNYLLTTQRVKLALKKRDAYLLVANTHGINIWCGAAGGHFNQHAVISVLKTSGIDKLVDHRTLLLPQLAAAGVESKIIKEKTGWKPVWGPVYAKDIPAFIDNKLIKNDKMRIVTFPLLQRIEMAIFWAVPISLFLSIFIFFFFPHLLLVANLLIWGLAFFLLSAFPLFDNLSTKNNDNSKKPLFSFFQGGIQIILFSIITAGFYIYHLAAGTTLWPLFVEQAVLAFIIVLLMTIDLTGLTPLTFSGFLDKGYSIRVDKTRCKGDGICIDVCPKNCFDRTKDTPGIRLACPDACVSCGACIIQCPRDAISFFTRNGDEIIPDTIRKYKLTMMGKRKQVEK